MNDFEKINLNENLKVDAEPHENLEDYNFENKSQLNLAIFYTLVASFFYCLSSLAMKDFGKYYSNSLVFEFSAFRHFGVVLTCFIVLKLKNIPINSVIQIPFKTKWVIIRTFSLTFGILLFAFSLTKLKLSIATIIINLNPLIICYLAYAFLGETIKAKYIIASIICLFGVWIMTLKNETNVDTIDQLNDSTNTIIGIISGLIATTGLAVVFISSKIIGRDYEPNNLTLIISFYGGLGSLLIVFILKGVSTLHVFFEFKFILISLSGGFLVSFAYIYTQQAFSLKINVSRIVNIFYAEIPFACIIGFLVYGETLNLYEFIGGTIIVSTIIFTNSDS